MGQVGQAIQTAPDPSSGGTNPLAQILTAGAGAFATTENALTTAKLAGKVQKVGSSPITYIVLGVAVVGIVGGVLLLRK